MISRKSSRLRSEYWPNYHLVFGIRSQIHQMTFQQVVICNNSPTRPSTKHRDNYLQWLKFIKWKEKKHSVAHAHMWWINKSFDEPLSVFLSNTSCWPPFVRVVVRTCCRQNPCREKQYNYFNSDKNLFLITDVAFWSTPDVAFWCTPAW